MNTVKITIDGKKIYAAAGTTILEAARKNGIDIPTLCYHPRLQPLGHCRMCLVEVEGMSKPITSCDNPVQEGMVVVTDTPLLREMREEILSLLLSTHPYEECLTCEKSGACELQEKTYQMCPKLPPALEKNMLPGLVQENPYIVREEDKCILCGRCIQVCREGAGRFVYNLAGRGTGTRVVPWRDGKEVTLEEAGCIFCGQCVDVCPVGALTERGRARKGREWEFSKAAGVCIGCSLQCAVERQVLRDSLVKVTVPREGDRFSWLCRKGKFGFYDVAAERITHPLIREWDGLREATWDEAIATAVAGFEAIKSKARGESLAVLGNGESSNEESFLLCKLARDGFGGGRIDLGLEPGWVAAALAARELGGTSAGPTIDCLLEAGAIFVIGAGLEESNPVIYMAVQRAARFGRAKIAWLGPLDTAAAGGATLKLAVGQRPGAALFKALTATLEGATPGPTAGATPEQLAEAARLFRGHEVYTIVTPAFVREAPAEDMKALLALAAAGGHLGGGRSDLLLPAAEGNAQGILETAGSPAADVRRSVSAGRVKGVFLAGEAPAGLNLSKVEFLVVQSAVMTEAARRAQVVFPAQFMFEKEGSFTGTDGRCRTNYPAATRQDLREDWRVITALAAGLGAPVEYATLEDVWQAMGRKVCS